jgi:hypothetical protein
VAINQLFLRLQQFGIRKRLLAGKALLKFTDEGLARFKDFLQNDGDDDYPQVDELDADDSTV